MEDGFSYVLLFIGLFVVIYFFLTQIVGMDNNGNIPDPQFDAQCATLDGKVLGDTCVLPDGRVVER